MKRESNLAWRYLDLCSFRFCPAARVEIANFAVWCPYNEPILKSNLKIILLKFDSSSFSFAFQRFSRAHDSWFALWYPYISPKSGSKGQKYVKNFSNIFHYCIMFSYFFNNSPVLHNALNVFLCNLILFAMLRLCFSIPNSEEIMCDMFFL